MYFAGVKHLYPYFMYEETEIQKVKLLSWCHVDNKQVEFTILHLPHKSSGSSSQPRVLTQWMLIKIRMTAS